MSAYLDVTGLRIDYPGRGAIPPLRAVREATLRCDRGESLGLVGESGCGKTSVANAIVGLVRPTRGRVRVGEQQVAPSRRLDRRGLARRVQMVFQDPAGALNPRLTVAGTLGEVLAVHGMAANGDAGAAVRRLLDRVELSGTLARRFPHELSGGQRQRVCIARALAVEPSLIVADEPVSALDVSVQVQILNLLRRLQRETRMAMLFIAHDLATVRYACDRVAVMRAGELVEEGAVNTVFRNPKHPYTRMLLAAVPDVEEGLKRRRRQPLP